MKGGGEIVQVDGGHILRATGRKDRHSKVYTAKGPRDRRVRLAAHTAIQFYDVQDRLGYDRPSKAVDWLIKKAQAAIDKLNEVAPPWQPGGCSHTPTPDSNPSSSDLALDHHQSEGVCGYELIRPNTNHDSSSNNNNHNHNNNNSNNNSSSFIVATESFFPTSSFAGFANDPCQTSSFHAEDLGLSLQTFHSDSHGNSSLPFQESFQRIDSWNNAGGSGGNNSGGDQMGSRVSGVLLNSQQPIFPFAHRELLQSNAALIPWNQRPLIPINHHHHDRDHLEPRTSKSLNFENPFELGFRVPARIYGEEEAENHR